MKSNITKINPDIKELDKYLKKIQELQGGGKLVCGVMKQAVSDIHCISS